MTLKEQAAAIIEEYESLEGMAGIPQIDLDGVPEAEREEVAGLLAELNRVVASNPLELFKPHEPNAEGKREQLRFLAAVTKVVAAFCGNQSGKTTIGLVKALIQCLPLEFVPRHLRPFKQFDAPCHGWVLCPSEDKVFDSMRPALERWCPKAALKGGAWGKAFNGERMLLTFACGSTIAFKTYRQDPSTLTSATIDWVLYDEPPPQSHRDECITRLLQSDGPEWFAMTPLKSNVGWVRRVIWRHREDPNITVCKWSMHDNPRLPKQSIERILASYKNDIWRQAREHGDFMDAAGLIYADFESCVVRPLAPEFVRGLENVVGIDPGIQNAAFIFGGFDQHGVDHVWDELLIQDGIPTQYAAGIDGILGRWGLKRDDVTFVIDVAARQRSALDGQTLQSALALLGISTATGNRDKEVGQQQIRDRLKYRRLLIGENCLGLRDEADEFAWEIDDDIASGPGDDSPYHRLATLRYHVMTRPWHRHIEQAAAERNLGWTPGFVPDLSRFQPRREVGPMGSMS